jgi:SAM-dependent methyltransferase
MTKSKLGRTSIVQLIRERRTRDAIYHSSTYWDERAHGREGLARSIWPSNVFNEVWDERQRDVLVRTLGSLEGHRVVDVGCGTGRMTRFFGSLGADLVVGMDFSPDTVRAAEAESRELGAGPNVRFAVGNVLEPLDHVAQDFDDAVVLGCLSVACQSLADLELALLNIRGLVRPGGRVVLLEPIHRSPLLRRILNLGLEDWIAAANRAGLSLTGSDRMGFAPLRLVLSVRDLPRGIVRSAFGLGETLLDAQPYLASLSDYKLLSFERV